MIRISDFYSLVKIFFKNIFSFKLSFEQQFKLFITKAFEILFRVYVKKVDDRFFHSNERKDRFKSKGFIKRTVTTAFGYVTFERRKYVDKKTGVCYYIDEKIGLKQYRRLSEELIFTILFEYQHTAASFVAKTYGISKATVYNLVNSFEMPKLNIERFETFFANYGKDRDKAHKVYFNGARADTMEKVIETIVWQILLSKQEKGQIFHV